MKSELTKPQRALIHIFGDCALLVLLFLLFFVVLLPVLLTQLPSIVQGTNPTSEFAEYESLKDITQVAILYTTLSILLFIFADILKTYFLIKRTKYMLRKTLVFWLICIVSLWICTLVYWQVYPAFALLGISDGVYFVILLILLQFVFFVCSYYRQTKIYKTKPKHLLYYAVGVIFTCVLIGQLTLLGWLGILMLFSLHSVYFFYQYIWKDE
jgi:hypothetical protein